MGEQITNDLNLGRNMDQVIEAINISGVNNQDIRLFIGYCVWDAGELEAEIKEVF